MARTFIGLGSNVGDRLGYLRDALRRLRNLDALSVVRCSSVYETEPVGGRTKEDFLNAVVECASDCDARNLVPILKELERTIGRSPGVRLGPREIDLDLLYCGDMVIIDRVVRLPHPEVPERRFVLIPLCEIAPAFTDPLTGRRMADLLAACPGTERVTAIQEPL